MTLPRVAIVFPSGEDVRVRFVLSLINLVQANAHRVAVVANAAGCRLAFNRNSLVRIAQEQKATHMLTIDTDMIFPSDALEKLLVHDLDIVGATAARRNDDNNAIGVTLDGSRLQVPSPPVRMRLLGMPFTLIKMEVFDRLKSPWFAEPPGDFLGDLTPEDQYFCDRAIEAGYDVWCDPNLSMEMQHRGAHNFSIMKPQKD